MARLFQSLLIGLGALMLLLIIAIAYAATSMQPPKPEMPKRIILETTFHGGLIEHVPQDPIALALGQSQTSLGQVTSTIYKAANDDRVEGLIVRIGSGFGLPARVQELRDAVIQFRSQGKTAIAWVETFPMARGGMLSYYLATAFDEIHMLPVGDVNITGLQSEAQFLKGGLEKLGVTPDMDHRYEYKNALNQYTEDAMTEAHREAAMRIIDSQMEQMATAIAEARGFGAQQLDALLDQGMFVSQDALSAGLIDKIGYRDEAYDSIKAAASEGAELLYLGAYAALTYEEQDPKADKVALIYGVGGVMQGPSEFDPLSGSQTMGSDTVTSAFRSAIADDSVKAIVFRVDSPGGSPVASQLIWRESMRASEAGKPVIATMGDLAGSGGYFVAMGADKILAQPGTITGSIGVLGGKIVTAELMNKLGITFDSVETHQNAGMWTSTETFTEAQNALMQKWLDQIYTQFTEGVAEGRNMSVEDVHAIAKGRIWTGADALSNGLVDELGGLHEAFALARTTAGMVDDAPVQVFPTPKSPIELLLEQVQGGGSKNSEQAAMISRIKLLEFLRPILHIVEQTSLSVGESALTMPAN